MNTKRTVLIGIAVIVMLAAGCSNNSKVTGPQAPIDEISNVSDITTTPTVSKPEAPMPRLWLELTGKLLRSELEGGCWYFETKKGERYEPHFEHIDAAVVPGVTMNVKGYIDYQINSICMIGPGLYITHYEVIKSEGMKMRPNPPLVKLSGRLGQTKDGCYFVAIPKENVALNLYFSPSPKLLGSRIVVTGSWSVLDFVPCDMVRLLNVETFTVIGLPPTPVDW